MKNDHEGKCLKDFVDILPGHPFRGTIKQYEDGNVNVVQVRDISAIGEMDLGDLVQTKVTGKKSPVWLEQGDILFVAKGSKHYSAHLDFILPRTVCSPHFFLIRVKPEFKEVITSHFLSWQLNQFPAQTYFKKTAEGSKYLSIRRQVLENTPIKVLPMKRQKLISEMHKTAMQERKALLKMIENRQQLLEAVAIKELD